MTVNGRVASFLFFSILLTEKVSHRIQIAVVSDLVSGFLILNMQLKGTHMGRLLKTIAVLSILFGTGTVEAQPKLVVEGGSSFDLDTLMAGTVAERKIALRNAGTEELILGKVEASCGCTGTLLSSEKLKPGEKGELLITFNSKNFNGKVHKTVTVNSNDPQSPKAKVEFTAVVTDEVYISENRFMFKEAVVGERKTSSVTLVNNGKQKLELKDYTTSLPGFTLKYPSSVAPGESVQLVAEFVPKEPKKVLSSNVALQTSNPNKPEIVLYVFGNVKEWKFE